jgi:hypothetical protein
MWAKWGRPCVGGWEGPRTDLLGTDDGCDGEAQLDQRKHQHNAKVLGRSAHAPMSPRHTRTHAHTHTRTHTHTHTHRACLCAQTAAYEEEEEAVLADGANEADKGNDAQQHAQDHHACTTHTGAHTHTYTKTHAHTCIQRQKDTGDPAVSDAWLPMDLSVSLSVVGGRTDGDRGRLEAYQLDAQRMAAQPDQNNARELCVCVRACVCVCHA